MATFNGTLDITMHDAQLTIPQHLSKIDPYCVVTLGSSGIKNLVEGETLGKEKFQTKVHNGAGQHPVWNETHSLSLKNMTFASHLKVKLYDKDMIKDDYLGVFKVNLDELLKFDGKGVQYFPIYKKGALKLKGESMGQVGVAVKFNCTEIPQGGGDVKASTVGTGTGMVGTGMVGTGMVGGMAGSGTGMSGTGTGMTGTRVPGSGITGITDSGMTGTTAGSHPVTGTGMTGTGMTGSYPVTTFNGSIDITISDANILMAQHFSKIDPYCIVALGSTGLKSVMEGQHIGKEKFQTKVHNGAGQHPIWNETHTLSLQNMKFDSWLEVRIYDKDMFKDDYVAIARMTLGELLPFDKKGVQYFPIFKKGALGQTKSEQIGKVGVGVVFNCTDMPQGQGDWKSQASDAMSRKQQQVGGVSGPYQTAQPTQPTAYTQGGSTTVNQPMQTKPVPTQSTMVQGTQGQLHQGQFQGTQVPLQGTQGQVYTQGGQAM